jgi:DNA repair protein RadA
MKMTSRLKEFTLEEIPNIASDMIDRLRELNMNSVYQLAVQNPIELVSSINDPQFDVVSASSLIGNARKILTENEVLSKEFSTADDLLEKRNKISRYTTGSEKFDDFLNGGFESQAITEIAGEFGSGKSQICHSLCVAANQLAENSRLGDSDEDKQSMVETIIFIDTENTFRADRVYQIAEQNGFDPLTILQKIYHCKIFNSEELESLINNLSQYIEQYNAKLVIVDSIISLHRAEFSGRETIAERQQRLGKMLNKLRRYADIYNIAVVITNQVVSYTDNPQFGSDYIKPAGGNIMGHNSTYRIFLKRSGKNRIATMFDSPYHPNQQTKFAISDDGIRNTTSYKSPENDGGDSTW